MTRQDGPFRAYTILALRTSFPRAFNLGLRFFLELFAFGSLFYWGVWISDGWLPGILVGTFALLAAAAVWGVFASPRARVALPLAGRLIVEALVFGSSGFALAAPGHRRMAVALVVLAAVNRLFIHLWRQDERDK